MFRRMAVMVTVALASALTLPTLAATDGPGYTTGEVRKIDTEQSKLTLKHGPIENLGMPAMTMVFRLKGATLPPALKVGDAVRFKAEAVDGTLTITELVAVK